jgi:hypothetical protein
MIALRTLSEGTTNLRSIRLLGATGIARKDTFDGKEYLVVPIVALVEGVVHASNAPEPEFVPVSTLASSVSGWNGRPVMLNHPMRDDVNVSANSPEILEKECFGIIFNAALKGKKLTYEAWLDADKAKVVGDKAVELYTRAEAGESVEVSIGAITGLEKKSGTYKGKSYSAVWTVIIPDHLAMLETGVLGACSNEMGCGVRAASAYRILNDEIEAEGESMDVVENEITEKNRTLRQRLTDLLTSTFRANKSPEEMSDREVRNALYNALYATVPAFAGIDDVISAQKVVIYAALREGLYVVFQQAYSLDEKGKVTLEGSAVEGRLESVFVPLSSSTNTVTAASSGGSCGCGSKSTERATESHEEKPMKTKEERLKALIARPGSRFKQADLSFLTAVTDEQLAALEAEAPVTPEPTAPVTPPVVETPAPAATTAPVALAAPKAQTMDEFLNSAPAEIASIMRGAMATQDALKKEVIKSLKATNRCDLSEADLNAMPMATLQNLAKLAGVNTAPETVDFGLSAPRAAASSTDDGPDDAPDFINAVRTANAKK